MPETKTYEIETSLTLDYRRNRWGLERIVLDGVGNHAPADSKGSKLYVKLKQDGTYVDLKEADQNKETEEVIFEDNGKGYDAKLLSVLFSTKTADALSVGQFGEGLKMVAAAAIRNKLDIEYHSRNWIAIPYTKKETIDEHEIDRLCFRIIENGYSLNGSRTVIKNPNKDLMEEIFKLPENVLLLDETVETLHEKGLDGQYKDKIIDRENKEKAIFVKGFRIQGESALFSYDLGIEDITPDRFYAHTDTVNNRIEFLLKTCTNTDVIEKIIRAAHEDPDSNYKEFIALNEYRKMPQPDRGCNYGGMIYKKLYDFEDLDGCIIKIDKLKLGDFIINAGKTRDLENTLWAETFKKLYGENAVVASTNDELNEDAELMGFNPININRPVGYYLKVNGVKKVDDFVKKNTDRVYKWIDQNELSIEERLMLENRYRINEKVFGSRKEDIPVKIYSALYIGNKEIEDLSGVTIIESQDAYIGIKRSVLKDKKEFYKTYLHELGHYKTRAGDRNRYFVDVFVDIIAEDIMKDEE